MADSPAAVLPALRDDACIGFVNTLSWRGSTPVEGLGDVTALLDWLGASGCVDGARLARARAWARGHGAAAARLLAEAVVLREVIHRILAAVATGDPVRADDVAALNRALAAAPARRRIARAGRGHGWLIAVQSWTAPGLLAPVLWSAGDLLAGAGRARLRRCANPKCLWLFLDSSKTGTRRWCDMASCGNRAKARRHYLRSRRD